MISLREHSEPTEIQEKRPRSSMRKLIIVGIFLDIILITVFSLWLFYSKSSSEFDMMSENLQKTQEINRDLFRKVESLEAGIEPEYKNDVVLSVSNSVLNKMSQNLFPLEFPLKGSVTGMVYGEELSNFQFLEKGRILFRLKLRGKKLKYNPRGDSMTDRLLGGTQLQEEIILNGTGEIRFVFDEEEQRLDLRYDIAAIDFQTGLPQFLEKAVKDRLKKELKTRPNFVEFNFKPLKVKLGSKQTKGYYHVTDVEIQANRLMAIAELRFKNNSEEETDER